VHFRCPQRKNWGVWGLWIWLATHIPARTITHGSFYMLVSSVFHGLSTDQYPKLYLFTWPVIWRITSSLNITLSMRFSLFRNIHRIPLSDEDQYHVTCAPNEDLWGWKLRALSILWIDQQLTPVCCTNFHVNFCGLTSWHSTVVVVVSSLVTVTGLLLWWWTLCLNFCRILNMIYQLTGL
jgi:hypothetical protein